MIALRLPMLRPLALHLPPRLCAALPAVTWACRWLGLGLALGALTDLVVRLAA